MLELRQQLKTASVSNKGGEKESDRLKKELDKVRLASVPQKSDLSCNCCGIQLPWPPETMKDMSCWHAYRAMPFSGTQISKHNIRSASALQVLNVYDDSA